MIHTHSEKTNSKFQGTIIDLETIGNLDHDKYNDSRAYRQLLPVIVGYINHATITIHYAKNKKEIPELIEKIPSILEQLEKPFHAFNVNFEKSIIYYNTNKEIEFEKELNQQKFESKRNAVTELGIPQYNDPFNDNGFKCMQAWLKGETAQAVKHNRSCLLKERDIMLRRGSRIPEQMKLIKTK